MKPGIDYIGVIAPFFCHDGNGNFLFYKRSKNAKDEKGKWDCSGGTVQFGEQPIEAVRRKLKIQYGCEGEIQEQLSACSVLIEIDGVKNHWLAVPFILKVDSKDVKISEPEKMDEIAWFRLSNLPKPLHSGVEYILNLYPEIFNKIAN